MSRKVIDKRYLARLVSSEIERKPCAFCLRNVDDEITFGKLYAIGDIQCHYFCCLLSCCLIQKGHDEEGLLGFMYKDIIAEIERCKKHRCSYCGRNGANMGCTVGSCRKQFHLPCGREKNAVSLYYGTYKSFCQHHAPKQRIPDHIMNKARLRMKYAKNKHNMVKEDKNICVKNVESKDDEDMVCVICYESVDGYPNLNTFWPPCCARDAWFHRNCLQRMALSAGMHYLKCPLCNDKDQFYNAVVSQGYYVPDRDAAWELEQNAFAEIYERPVTCCADVCKCPLGREHDSENGEWDIKLCLLCGSAGAHALCIYEQANNHTSPPQTNNPPNNKINPPQTLNPLDNKINPPQNSNDSNKPSHLITVSQSPTDQAQRWEDKCTRYVCKCCMPAAPEDLETLANNLEAIIQREQVANAANARRPLMPSRMSLRRTKGRTNIHLASSSTTNNLFNNNCKAENELTVMQTEQMANAVNSRSPLMPSRISLARTKGRTNIHLPTSSSTSNDHLIDNNINSENELIEQTNVNRSRQELNLKSPKKPMCQESNIIIRQTDKLLSPFKLLEQSFKEKVVCTGVRDAVLDENIIEKLRKKFRKPRPFSEKKKIIDDILDGLLDDLIKNPKENCQMRKWCTPKKSCDRNEIKAEENDVEKAINNETDNENINSNVMPTKENLNDLNIKESPTNYVESEEQDVGEEIKHEIKDNEEKIDDLTEDNSKEKVPEKNASEINDKIIKEHQNSDEKRKSVKKDKNKTSRITKEKTRKKFKKLQLIRGENVKKLEPKLLNGDILRNLLLSELSPRSSTDNKITQEPIFETRDKEKAHRKTIDTLQDSSLEISENDQTINIDVIKLDENTQKDAYKQLNVKLPDQAKCSFKFNALDKEQLEQNNCDIYIEKFKTEYLNEVDREFKCSYNHKHVEKTPDSIKIRTAIDFAVKAAIKKENEEIKKEPERIKKKERTKKEPVNNEKVFNRKRKMTSPIVLSYDGDIKKRKTENNLKVSENEPEVTLSQDDMSKGTKKKRSEKVRKRSKKRKIMKKNKNKKNIELTIDSSEKRSKDRIIKKKIKTKFAIQDSDIKLKIKWKKKQLSLNIESKEQKKKKEKHSKFKQYVLQFPEGPSKEVLVKPEKDVKLKKSPKRKYIKQEKSPDKYKQMLIQNFFKLKSPMNEYEES